MTYDYIILGAGITGLTLLKKMRQKGIVNILALEAEKEPGGLRRIFFMILPAVFCMLPVSGLLRKTRISRRAGSPVCL